jgi:hypothetical protein
MRSKRQPLAARGNSLALVQAIFWPSVSQTFATGAPPLFHNCSIPIGPKTRALARATIGGGGDDPSVIGRGPPATGGSPRTDARSRYLESDRFRASGLRSQAGPRRRAS